MYIYTVYEFVSKCVKCVYVSVSAYVYVFIFVNFKDIDIIRL